MFTIRERHKSHFYYNMTLTDVNYPMLENRLLVLSRLMPCVLPKHNLSRTSTRKSKLPCVGHNGAGHPMRVAHPCKTRLILLPSESIRFREKKNAERLPYEGRPLVLPSITNLSLPESVHGRGIITKNKCNPQILEKWSLDLMWMWKIN